jgi:hypothetical protein
MSRLVRLRNGNVLRRDYKPTNSLNVFRGTFDASAASVVAVGEPSSFKVADSGEEDVGAFGASSSRSLVSLSVWDTLRFLAEGAISGLWFEN